MRVGVRVFFRHKIVQAVAKQAVATGASIQYLELVSEIDGMKWEA